MTNSNQTSTRFKDEMRIVSPWGFFIAVMLGLALAVLFVVFVGMDPKAPTLPVRCLLAAVMATLVACYVVLIRYINADAGRRGMSRVWWTLLAIFVPNGLGIVLYFVLRKPRAAHCPQCSAQVEPGFSFCPRCSYRLQPACPTCHRSVDFADKFCPYCGGSLNQPPAAPANQ